MFVKFNVSVETWVTREGDPEDPWDNDSTDGNVAVLSAHLSEEDSYTALPISFHAQPGDKIWLVWAQYSTGDSFGHYGGQYELCSVFSRADEAEKEKERLKNVMDCSVPWNGYFESLQFVSVDALVLK